jgi:DNA modification methylase
MGSYDRGMAGEDGRVSVRIIIGDVRDKLAELPDESVHCCVTSPPYFGLRDYGVVGQIGLEATPDAYVVELVSVFREVRRVLRSDGTLWLNLGDSYGSGGMSNPSSKSTLGGGKDRGAANYSLSRRAPDGIKPKDLLGIPWRVAFALQADGWWLRSDIIWHKPNPMPESVTDRPTSAHEHIFMLAKSERYYFDADAVREPFAEEWLSTRKPYTIKGNTSRKDGGQPPQSANPLGRNIRNVWTIATQPYSEAHFATFPPALVEPCIKAGCPVGGTVLDPFGGAGTTGLVADRLGRSAILTELNPEYAEIARKRISGDAGMFAKVDAA